VASRSPVTCRDRIGGFVVLAISQPMLGQSSRRKARALKVRRCMSGFLVRKPRPGAMWWPAALTTHHIRNAGGIILIVADDGRNNCQNDLPLYSTLDQLALGATPLNF
jgi:hypothetical protein